MVKLSAVVSAYNEEKHLAKCLESLSFADEIVVVDNSSTDKTADIAKKFTSNIYTQENDVAKIDIQKNYGFEKATGEWILSIDADEVVTDELGKEIKKILDSNPSSIGEINGFWIPRKNYMFGKLIEHTGWYPDYQLRLFRKGKGKYTAKHVHEDLTLNGNSAKLKEDIVHNNYESILQFTSKTLNYAQNEAENLLDKGYQLSHFDAIRFPVNEFLSRFFARKGYKDGFHGLVLSLLMAFYHFIIFTMIWEKKGFRDYKSDDFLKEVWQEFRKSGKDIAFWFANEKMEEIRNPIKKTFHKIKTRINK